VVWRGPCRLGGVMNGLCDLGPLARVWLTGGFGVGELALTESAEVS
jgi:hypothetical protein